MSRVSGHCPQLASRLGVAEPPGRQDARYPDLLLLGGRVVALGLSFHFPVAGQRVAARSGLDSISRAVLTQLPAAQVDARGTPQLGEGSCEFGEPASPGFPALVDVASGGLCRLARSGASPSWSGPSPPAGGSTQGPAHSSCGCPPGRRWDSAAGTGQRALWAPGRAGSPVCGCRLRPGGALGTALPRPRPAPACTWDPAPPQHLLVLGGPPTPRPSTCLYLAGRLQPQACSRPSSLRTCSRTWRYCSRFCSRRADDVQSLAGKGGRVTRSAAGRLRPGAPPPGPAPPSPGTHLTAQRPLQQLAPAQVCLSPSPTAVPLSFPFPSGETPTVF